MRRPTPLPISQKKAMTATTKPAKVQPASAANLEIGRASCRERVSLNV